MCSGKGEVMAGNCPIEPLTKDGIIIIKLNECNNSMSELEFQLERLAEKLRSVLMPHGTLGVEAQGNEPAISLPPLAEDLAVLYRRHGIAIDHLRNLIGRLEL